MYFKGLEKHYPQTITFRCGLILPPFNTGVSPWASYNCDICHIHCTRAITAVNKQVGYEELIPSVLFFFKTLCLPRSF